MWYVSYISISYISITIISIIVISIMIITMKTRHVPNENIPILDKARYLCIIPVELIGDYAYKRNPIK